VNLRGEPAHVGRHCGSNEYEVTKEVVAFYADALDDHHPLHTSYAPPLLYHSECYRFVGEWYLKNLFGNLHARQDWELFGPIEIGRRVRTRSTIVDRYTKRGRDYVVNETDVLDADDLRLLVRGRTHQSFLPPRPEGAGAGQRFAVDEGTASRKQEAARGKGQGAQPAFPTATGPELPAATCTVDARRCWMFSGPGRNYHTDAEEARKLGFPTIVVQGMMSTCFVSRVMQEHFGMGWLEGGRMSVKLTNVIWVDETVVTRARVSEEVGEGTRTRVLCEVWADKTDGTRTLVGTASALREA
jgi:acyl dehydratase